MKVANAIEIIENAKAARMAAGLHSQDDLYRIHVANGMRYVLVYPSFTRSFIDWDWKQSRLEIVQGLPELLDIKYIGDLEDVDLEDLDSIATETIADILAGAIPENDFEFWDELLE